MWDTLCEDLPGHPDSVRPAFGEIDHRFLGAPQIKRRLAALHSLTDGPNIRIDVRVQKLKKQAEIRRVTLVRGCGQQEDMVSGIPQKLAKRIPGRLARRRRPGHPVGLVHNDQIPVDLPESGQNVLSFGQVKRGDGFLLFKPLIDPKLVPDVAALEDQKLLVELLSQFPLPLEGEIGRANDQDSFCKSPQLEFPDEQPCHDRLARPRVVGQQKLHPGRLQKVVIHGF